MLWNADFVPWLCWIFPIVGAIFPIILPGKIRGAKGIAVVIFSFGMAHGYFHDPRPIQL